MKDWVLFFLRGCFLVTLRLCLFSVILSVISWIFLPAWTITSESFWGCILVTCFIWFVMVIFLEDLENSDDGLGRATLPMGFILFIVMIFCIIVLISFWADNAQIGYHKNIYKGLSVSETERRKESDFITDLETDRKKMSNLFIPKVLVFREKYNAPEGYDIDDGYYDLVLYNDKLCVVSPLSYHGFINWCKKENILGYVLIEFTTGKVQYIKNTIYYSESAYFGKDIERYLRKKFKSYQFGKIFFEIDENGKPYYLISVIYPKRPESNYGIKVVKSFILLDACSGECLEYQPEKLPDWVDGDYFSYHVY